MATLSERRTVDAPVAAVGAGLAEVASLPEVWGSTTVVVV